MIVDTSALIAILRDEPDAATYAQAIASVSSRRVSAVSYVETAAGIIPAMIQLRAVGLMICCARPTL